MAYFALEQNYDTLKHFGIKGMKWGVRHDRERTGRTRKPINWQRVKNTALDAATMGIWGRGLYNLGKGTVRLAKGDNIGATARYIRSIGDNLVAMKIMKSRDKAGKRRLEENGYRMEPGRYDHPVTRQAKKDWNRMGNKKFQKKYNITRQGYQTWVNRYGDPYENRIAGVLFGNSSAIADQSRRRKR